MRHSKKEKNFLLTLLFSISLLAASCVADTPISEETVPGSTAAVDSAASVPTEPGQAACEEMIFAYFFSSRQSSGTDIIAICPDGSDPRQLTTGGLNANAPRWSPDRSQIAYLSDRSGLNQLHIMDKDGGNDRQITSASDLEAWNVLWLPDGNRIAIWGVFNDDWQWQAVNVLTGEITPLDEWSFEGDWVSISHDGTRVAYVVRTDLYNADSPAEIYIQNLDGSNSYQLTSTGWNIQNPIWSPDDSQITFLSGSEYGNAQNSPDTIQNAIYTVNLVGGNIHELLLPDINPSSIAWSSDGKSLAVTIAEMFETGDIECPERPMQTLYLVDIITGEITALYKAIAPNHIMHLSWY